MKLQDIKNKIASECDFHAVPYGHCISCKQPFTDENVYSSLGWKETRITQMCERCFDRCTEERDE